MNYRDDFRATQREYYWTLPRVFAAAVLTIALLCLIAFGVNYFAYGSASFFAPRHEAVRRDTMIQSRAYSEATTREMYRLKLQYQQAATDDARATIKAMALHESRAFDRDRLPADLQLFIKQIED